MSIKPHNTELLRQMDVGETRITPLDNPANAGTWLQAIACKIGCKITTNKLLLVDPSTYECIPVVAITKLSEARPPKKRGRPRKTKS